MAQTPRSSPLTFYLLAQPGVADRLLPFFCYFGGKWRAAKKYPIPQHERVIEPFAGGAGYALNHFNHQVVLYEIDPTIYGLWDYLIKVKPAEILALPSKVEHVDEVTGPAAARALVGFWLNKGGTSPKKTPSVWARSGIRPNSFWGQTIKERIASQVDRIKHWTVKNVSYTTAENERATWFVDPPYQGACGNAYKYRTIDRQKRGPLPSTKVGC